MKNTTCVHLTVMTGVFSLWLGIWSSLPREVRAQSGHQEAELPKFEVDPFWPKPLPDRWVTGEVGGVCVDAQDHVFTLNRGNLLTFEQKNATAAPLVTEFDQEGTLVNSWGNRDLLPTGLHGCFVDYQRNIWIGGNQDAIVQKYTHDGSKMLLQIGTRGKFDSSDGSGNGAAMNSSHVFLNGPTSVAVDPTNGDVYIADGYTNRRVVVFDRDGKFLRQWGRQGTLDEIDAGVGGVFLREVHCVVIANDGLVYVCDRYGNQIQVFDKMGNFRRNILVESKATRLPGVGSACWIGFSPGPAQKFAYVGDCAYGEVRVLDRATGQTLSRFGRPGNQVGEIADPHTIAVDSKGNVVVGDTANGRRIQMWRPVK
jgi:hypothetical protein